MSGTQSKYLDDLSKCVLCGSCKAFCPTFDDEGTEGMSARGRLMLLRGLISGEIKPSPLLNERIFSCILCGACEGTCPLGVDIPEAIYRGRALLCKSDPKRKRIRSLVKFSTSWPELSFRLLRMSKHAILPSLVRRDVIPFLPDIPATSLRLTEQVYKVSNRRGRVALFAGCSVNFIFPHLGESLIHVMNALGYEVVLPKGLSCCGAPLRNLGLEEEAKALARRNIRSLNRLKVDAILSPCPTCTLMLSRYYPKFIDEGLEKAVDISVFLKERLDDTDPIQKSSVYHDPCHLYYGLGIRDEPREIIRKAGIELIDAEASGCCGFGGLFCLSFKDLSSRLLNTCAQNLLRTDAETVITSCPGCMLQLSQRITDRPVLHLIEIIEEAYCERPLRTQEGVAVTES